MPGDELANRKVRYATLRAEMLQIAIEKERGTLSPADRLEQALVYMITTVRTGLLGLPRRLAETLAPDNPQFVERKLEAEIDGLLNELASDETLPEWIEENGDGRIPTQDPRQTRSGT